MLGKSMVQAVILGTMVMLGSYFMAGAAVAAGPVAEAHPIDVSEEIAAVAYTGANEFITALDRLRNLASDQPLVFRNPGVYEFSAQLDHLRTTAHAGAQDLVQGVAD